MALSKTIDDREYKKFIESSTRPDQSMVETYIAGGNVNTTITPVTSDTATCDGITVSTTAVLLVASNTDRVNLLITNNSSGKLYIGKDNTVTTSGSTMGLLVNPCGTYSDAGSGVYTGDLYGIYSEVAATENVSVSERT